MKNFAIGLVVGVILTIACGYWLIERHQKFTTPYQGVLLDDNQVFYGKLSQLSGAHPILTAVELVPGPIQKSEVRSSLGFGEFTMDCDLGSVHFG